ncbi:O-methyltransferase-domain-containing protein [Aspergillus aurantiobrunneus]
MEATLSILNASLAEASAQLTGPLNTERLAALHDHREEILPDAALSDLAARTIDLLHQVEQLLEPSSLVLADHFLGYLSSKCLSAAVEFNVPDMLADGPKSVSELAQLAGAREDRLRQVLRLLYNNGIFTYDGVSDTVSNNLTSEMLLTTHWTQWHNWVDLYGNEFYDMARGIPASLREGTVRTPAQINFDTDENMFNYFTRQGWLPRLHRTLGGGATAQAPGILADYPWEEFGDRTFLDIGGGEGALVALLLRRYPALRGALLDTPKDGKFADVGDRVGEGGLIAGDFLEEIPSFEFYTMKWCLHDWDDEKAGTVLRNIRKAIKVTSESRLVVMESILADGRSSRLTRYADLTMMVSADGQERTEAQWRELAGRTGWEVRLVRRLRGAWPKVMDSKADVPVVLGDVDYDGRVVLYVIKADETSYINYIKPLILAREMNIPHLLSVIDTKAEWFYRIHPERMVPSLKDQDPETKQEVIVFESTACLQYLADRFDDGSWSGRTAWEKGAVLSWTSYQTAALGPTAKYWLYFLRGYPTRKEPVQLPRTIEKLHSNCLRQWDILEKRLSIAGQDYIALPDRPTLADLSYFPFAMPWMFQFLGVDIKDWPHIEAWSQRMLGRPAIKAVLETAPTIGH